MRRVIEVLLCAFILIGCMNSARAIGFDISGFENNPDLFSVYRENGNVFIESNLTSEDKDFSHKYNSEFYYNSIFPDIIILYAGTENEVVIPRIWIVYRTEYNALSIKRVEFSLYNSVYSFSVENSPISALEKGTISEEALIVIDEQGLGLLNDWHYVASIGKSINVKLIGSTDTVEFEIPARVINAGMGMIEAYAMGGGAASIRNYTGTPVAVRTRNEPVPQNMYQVHCDESNGTTFLIPSGWAVVWNDGNDESTSVKIRWESEDRSTYANIQYKAIDIYRQMLHSTEFEGVEEDVDRSMLDNTMMTKADYAEVFGVPVQEVRYEKYGDYMYYTATISKTENIAPNHEQSIIVQFFSNIDNGIMYMFSFTGEESKLIDFEELITTVKHSN